MARFAFVCPPYRGHLTPMMALANRLVAAGHAVLFVGIPDAAALPRAHGFDTAAIGAASHPVGSLAALADRLAAVNGPFGLGAMIRDVAALTDAVCRDLPAVLRAARTDCLVVDQAEAGGGLVAAHLGMPSVSVANALPLDREPLVPPPFTAWPYRASPWGRERNAGGYRVADWLMRPHAAVIADHAARWRLGPRRRLTECLSPFAAVAQMVEGLDLPRAELPATFHYCGPFRDAALDPPAVALPAAGARPLVYASLGTLQGGRAGLCLTIAEAVERLGGTLVLAHGGRLGADVARRLPGRTIVHDFVPQAAVLAEADLAILNGGLNTVLDALAAGVPAIVVPIAFEQGAIASRLERSGAGRHVSRHGLGAGRLAREAAMLLASGSARRAAGRLGREIAGAGGVDKAARIVERVALTGRPVTRDDLAPPASLAA